MIRAKQFLVPLQAEREGVAFEFDGFDPAVRRMRAGDDLRREFDNGFAVKAVHRDRAADQLVKF